MKVKAFLGLMAPHTWPAAVFPAIFAGVWCQYKHILVRLDLWILSLLICVLLQSVANIANDLADYRKGADQKTDCVEVMDSVLVHGYVSPLEALLLCMGCLGAAGLAGMWIVFQSGLAALAIGALGTVTALLYSCGPVPLSYLPIGELVSGCMMGGLIPLGVTAAISGEPDWQMLPFLVPFVLGIGLIMMTNNTCDIEKDVRSGRKTLPVILGRKKTKKLHAAVVMLWLGVIFIITATWGLTSLMTAGVLIVFSGHIVRTLLKASLVQEERVEWMQMILKANIVMGAAYIAALAVACVWR